MTENKVIVGPFQANCWIVACPKTAQAAVIDPGDDANKIIRAVEAAHLGGRSLDVRYLLLTHAHLDHIGAVSELRDVYKNSRIALHSADEPLYRQLKMQGQMFGIHYGEPAEPDEFVSDEQTLKLGELTLSVMHTPGHTAGGVCFRLHEYSDGKGVSLPETIYAGDTLFKGSIGRTDLWGGDYDQLIASINRKLLNCQDHVRVCSGHGPETTIGEERRSNPFLRPGSHYV